MESPRPTSKQNRLGTIPFELARRGCAHFPSLLPNFVEFLHDEIFASREHHVLLQKKLKASLGLHPSDVLYEQRTTWASEFSDTICSILTLTFPYTWFPVVPILGILTISGCLAVGSILSNSDVHWSEHSAMFW